MLSGRCLSRLGVLRTIASISPSLHLRPTQGVWLSFRLMSTSSPVPRLRDLRRAVEDGDGKLIAKFMFSMVHDSMPEELMRELLRQDVVLEILHLHISPRLIKSLLVRHPHLLTSKHCIALIQRSSKYPTALLKVINHCIEDCVRLPLETIESCIPLLLPENGLTAFLMYGLFDHETQQDRFQDFLSSFQNFLRDYCGESINASTQDVSITPEQRMVRTLMHPDFDPPIHLWHCRTLLLNNLHPLIAMKCVSHFIEERVIPTLLRGSPFDGKTVPSAAEIKAAKLSFQQALEITYRSHGFLLLLSSRKSEGKENYRDQIIDYLQQKHGITNFEKNPGIKFSKREALINKLYSAVRVSASLRRGGGISLSQNPVTIYVSPTELLQSLMPSLKIMECMSPTGSQIFEYRDPMAGLKVNALNDIFGDDIVRLKELQWKK